MNSEHGRYDRSIIDRARSTDETLSPEDRNRLGDLALLSQNHLGLGDSLAKAGRTMEMLVERHPEFDGSAEEMRVMVTQLHELMKELGKEVMRFSHVYEDTVAGSRRKPENDRIQRDFVGHQKDFERRRSDARADRFSVPFLKKGLFR